MTVATTTQLRAWMYKHHIADNTEVWIHNGIQSEKVTSIGDEGFRTDGVGYEYTYQDIFDCKYQFSVFTKVIGELIAIH